MRLWNVAAKRQDDICDAFVPKVAVVDPTAVQFVGQDEVDTVLQFQNVTDEQVTNLKGLRRT